MKGRPKDNSDEMLEALDGLRAAAEALWDVIGNTRTLENLSPATKDAIYKSTIVLDQVNGYIRQALGAQ